MGTQECINDNVVLGTLCELLRYQVISRYGNCITIHIQAHAHIHTPHITHTQTHARLAPTLLFSRYLFLGSLSATLLFSIYWPTLTVHFSALKFAMYQRHPSGTDRLCVQLREQQQRSDQYAAKHYLETTLGIQLGSSNLHKELQDGVLLCKYVDLSLLYYKNNNSKGAYSILFLPIS